MCPPRKSAAGPLICLGVIVAVAAASSTAAAAAVAVLNALLIAVLAIFGVAVLAVVVCLVRWYRHRNVAASYLALSREKRLGQSQPAALPAARPAITGADVPRETLELLARAHAARAVADEYEVLVRQLRG